MQIRTKCCIMNFQKTSEKIPSFCQQKESREQIKKKEWNRKVQIQVIIFCPGPSQIGEHVVGTVQGHAGWTRKNRHAFHMPRRQLVVRLFPCCLQGVTTEVTRICKYFTEKYRSKSLLGWKSNSVFGLCPEKENHSHTEATNPAMFTTSFA